MGRKLPNSGPDALIARVAANQHGVVSLAQLERAGIHERGRMRRVRRGRLHRVHRGVYAVGHWGLSGKGRCVRPDAVLSHTSAAALWQLLPQRGFVHVTVPGNQRSRAGIRVHRSRTLFASAVTRRDGIPVPTPSRTLADLRRLLPQQQFAAALRQAEFLQLPLDPALERDHTRSELEARFLALCRRHRLPQPEVNVPLALSPFEADRARDGELKAVGYDVIRLTWLQVTVRSTDLAHAVRRVLRASGQ